MHSSGPKIWAPNMRLAVEAFVERLKKLSPEEEVKIDADANREPMARFIRPSTGEIIGEFGYLGDRAGLYNE